jgi:hypothetical protein
MSAFPPVDIFISHNSPRGIHERNDDAYAGFDGLINYMFEHKPSICSTDISILIGKRYVMGLG